MFCVDEWRKQHGRVNQVCYSFFLAVKLAAYFHNTTYSTIRKGRKAAAERAIQYKTHSVIYITVRSTTTISI